MKRVLTAVILIPVVLLAVFRAPDWLFALLVAAVALLALGEYFQILHPSKPNAGSPGTSIVAGYAVEPFRFLGYLLTAAIFGIALWSAAAHSPATVAMALSALLCLSPFILLCAGMLRSNLRSGLPAACFTYLGIVYVSFSLVTLVFLRMLPGGWFFLLFTFFVVWAGDTFAYYVGRSIGRTPFAPRISPKKTWEGAIASAAGSVIFALLLIWLAPQIAAGLAQARLIVSPVHFASTPFRMTAIFAVILNIAAQLGDLLESLIKRGAAIKDSGNLLPGHGGVLDRIDALLLASPVALLLFSGTLEKFIRMP